MALFRLSDAANAKGSRQSLPPPPAAGTRQRHPGPFSAWAMPRTPRVRGNRCRRLPRLVRVNAIQGHPVRHSGCRAIEWAPDDSLPYHKVCWRGFT